MGTQVSTRDVHNCGRRGFFFGGRRGRLICVIWHQSAPGYVKQVLTYQQHNAIDLLNSTGAPLTSPTMSKHTLNNFNKMFKQSALWVNSHNLSSLQVVLHRGCSKIR